VEGEGRHPKGLRRAAARRDPEPVRRTGLMAASRLGSASRMQRRPVRCLFTTPTPSTACW
jgi:hypothetical protein